MTPPKKAPNHLRLNVGFLLKEGAGYSRDISFDNPSSFKIEEVTISHMQGSLRLSRTAQGVLAQGILEVAVEVECVRCLTLFDLPFAIEFSDAFFPASSPEAQTAEDAVHLIDEGDFIDLAPIVREEAILSIPIQTLHSPDCKGLCPECGHDLNTGPCSCVTDNIDPRFAILRTLLDKP